MSNSSSYPVASVMTRSMPSVSASCGFPTSSTRVDMTQAQPVLVPLLQDATLVSAQVAPPSRAKRRRVLSAAGLLIAVVVVVYVRYMLGL